MFERGSTEAALAGRPPRLRGAQRPRRAARAPGAADLVLRCQRGDQAAWRELFRQRSTQVARWAERLGAGTWEAEDTAQEVLAVAVRRIARCHGDEAIGAWLYQITRRVVANARRRLYLRRLHGGAARPADLGEPADPRAAAPQAPSPVALSPLESVLEARRCLRQLSPVQREVLVLVDVEGFSRREVAELLAIPAGTVASRLRLARQACGRHLTRPPVRSSQRR